MEAPYQDATGMEVGLGPGHIVLDGDPGPQFSAEVYCGQMAGWIKMTLGMEVGLGPGDFVFHGEPATPEQGAHPPPHSFGPMFIVAKRLEE